MNNVTKIKSSSRFIEDEFGNRYYGFTQEEVEAEVAIIKEKEKERLIKIELDNQRNKEIFIGIIETALATSSNEDKIVENIIVLERDYSLYAAKLYYRLLKNSIVNLSVKDYMERVFSPEDPNQIKYNLSDNY